MRHLLTTIAATTSLVAFSPSLRAESVIDMPPSPLPGVSATVGEDVPSAGTPDDGGLSGEPKSVGDIALNRYLGARSVPRDVWVQPRPAFGVGYRVSRRFIWPYRGPRYHFFHYAPVGSWCW